MKLIFFILSIGLLVYFYSPEPKTEISKPQEFFEKPCKNTPSLGCIKKFVQDNIEYPSDKKDYWSLSEDLTRAGLYKEALDVISKSDNSLNYIALKKIPVYQITKQANLYPKKVADFSLIEELTNPDNAVGKHIPETSYSTIKIRAYESLAFALIGHIGEAGQIDYVHYLEQAANEQFQKNETWNALLQRWEAEIEKNEEPMRSNDLMRIAERLIDIGDIKLAQSYLDKIKELPGSRKNNLSRALAEIGEYDAAIEVVKDERVKYAYYEASFAKVDRQIKGGNRESALKLLEQIETELLENKGRSGKLENLIKVISYYSKLEEALKAEQLANWIYDKIKNKEFSGLSYEKVPAAYREAGQLEKARKVMQDDVIIRYTKSCSSVSDEENGQYAQEMARLGVIEGYQRIIERICSPAQKSEAWIAVYKALIETEYPLPDINSVISTLPEYLHASFYNSLAAFHFKRGDKVKGNEFLDKAYKVAEMARGTDTLCHTAMVAHFSSRPDLLDGLLEKSIIVANITKTELPKHYNSSLLNAYFAAGKKEDNPRPLYRRFREYLNVASCYNLINLDALKRNQ